MAFFSNLRCRVSATATELSNYNQVLLNTDPAAQEPSNGGRTADGLINITQSVAQFEFLSLSDRAVNRSII